jgi:hypothetical protein
MEPKPFELTPEQKGMLASLSRETGKPMATLLAAIAAALEELQEREHVANADDESNGHETNASAPKEASKPIWEIFEEASRDIPDEVLARLPTDLAAQVDHYVYGLPKR